MGNFFSNCRRIEGIRLTKSCKVATANFYGSLLNLNKMNKEDENGDFFSNCRRIEERRLTKYCRVATASFYGFLLNLLI